MEVSRVRGGWQAGPGPHCARVQSRDGSAIVRTVPPSPRHPREIPPLWLLLALVLMAALRWLLPGPLLPELPLPWPWSWPWLGSGFACAAILLTVSAAVLFGLEQTGILPFTPATKLVVRGPYRWTRNPMYVGLTGLVFGVAVALGAASPFVVVPWFWWVLDRRFVRAEEAFLRERFGPAYDDYCRRVRRWL